MMLLDNIFLQYCADTLAATNSPLTGAKIAKLMGAYSIDFGVSIPDNITIAQEPNKRTLLFDYLKCFPFEHQITILRELCENQIFEKYEHKESILKLKGQLMKRLSQNNEVHSKDWTIASKKSAEELVKIVRESSKDCSIQKNKKMKRQIFISHSSKDADIINAFKTHILIAGLGLTDDDIVCTSFEETGIGAGDNIPQYIKEKIEDSEVVLCMISQSYKQSEVCQNEVGAAWALKKKIIQIVLPGCTFERVGWLLNLDKAIKIDSSKSLDNLQETLTRELLLVTKSPIKWNPHKDNFLNAIKFITQK